MLKLNFTIHDLCNNMFSNQKGGGKNLMEKLKKFREFLGLTQKEFADSIGVSMSLYVKIETRYKAT